MPANTPVADLVTAHVRDPAAADVLSIHALRPEDGDPVLLILRFPVGDVQDVEAMSTRPTTK